MLPLPNNWIALNVSDQDIADAQAIRAERDQQYANIYQERTTDERWVGDMGEILFNRWLTDQTIEHDWIQDKAAGQPDFRLGGTSVDIKTVKRQVPMRPDYTAQITARHAREEVAYYFFATYIVPRRQLWLLGGISKEAFLANARYYAAGEQVHANYTVRPGHEIYNIEVRHLQAPQDWLGAIRPAT
jgi:hypothetical protein